MFRARLLPTLGLPREPAEGDLRGGPAGRRRGAPSQPSMKGLLCGGGTGAACPFPSWEWTQQGCGAGGWVASLYGLRPSWHQPARSGEKPRSCLATVPPPLPGQMPPLPGGREGTSCP